MKTLRVVPVLLACGGALAQTAVPPPPVLTAPTSATVPAATATPQDPPAPKLPSSPTATPATGPAAVVPPAASVTTPDSANEPRVERLVSEDDGVRIEELRVRGQTVRVVVRPKGGAAAYEIVPGDSARDLSQGASSTRGAAGQRVWPVWSF